MSSTKLRVKELLRERRWTTKVLAEKTGMSESYLTHIKNGTRRWNEDALKKLSEAFSLDPVDLFANKNPKSVETYRDLVYTDEDLLGGFGLNKVKIVPIVGDIPSEPSSYTNHLLQVETGFENNFVAAFNSDDEDMFCFQVSDNEMAPRFQQGDQLLISPRLWTRSGDIVAVEHGNSLPYTKGIYLVSYMDDFVVLESVSHKTPPIALVKGKDNFKIIGKVVWRYQKLG
jgi:SOS-response transcriptional repressor LexA